MREKASWEVRSPISLTRSIQLDSLHHGLLLNTSLPCCVWMLLAYFGMYRWRHFLLWHTSRTQSVLSICRSTVLSSCCGSPSRPRIWVQSPVQASQLLEHTLLPSFYLIITPVNNLRMGDIWWLKHIVRMFHWNYLPVWDGARHTQSSEK